MSGEGFIVNCKACVQGFKAIHESDDRDLKFLIFECDQCGAVIIYINPSLRRGESNVH